MSSSWKSWLIIIAVVAAVAFFVVRVRRAVLARPPDRFKQVEHTSPSMLLNPGVRHAWEKLARLRTECARLAQQRQLANGWVNFIDADTAPAKSYVWLAIEYVNHGFDALSRIERDEGAANKTFVGYYSTTGIPLAYVEKPDPARPKQLLTTVILDAPIVAGATGSYYRVEQTGANVVKNKDGSFQVSAGHLPAAGDTVRAWGVGLPDGAEVVRYTPDAGTEVHAEGGTLVVWWINALLEDKRPPLSLTYRTAGGGK